MAGTEERIRKLRNSATTLATDGSAHIPHVSILTKVLTPAFHIISENSSNSLFLCIDCPHGAGKPVMGGHKVDFNTEGEQWAAVFGKDNHWVMIGQMYQNSLTTCTDRKDGVYVPESSQRKYIMCCSF